MTDWVEVIAGEANQKYRRAALVLKTLAWTLIFWAALISIWIWMGVRAGSNVWLWSAIGLFGVGVILLGIAVWLQRQAVRLMVSSAEGGKDVRAA
jgi:hypothetical protein